MDARWDLVRERIAKYLGAPDTPRDRAFKARRRALAAELGMQDVTLKGFLPAHLPRSRRSRSGRLGDDKLRRLLAKPDFRDLQVHFPELGLGAVQNIEVQQIQLELDFEGFNEIAGKQTVRLSASGEGRLRLIIKRIA